MKPCALSAVARPATPASSAGAQRDRGPPPTHRLPRRSSTKAGDAVGARTARGGRHSQSSGPRWNVNDRRAQAQAMALRTSQHSADSCSARGNSSRTCGSPASSLRSSASWEPTSRACRSVVSIPGRNRDRQRLRAPQDDVAPGLAPMSWRRREQRDVVVARAGRRRLRGSARTKRREVRSRKRGVRTQRMATPGANVSAEFEVDVGEECDRHSPGLIAARSAATSAELKPPSTTSRRWPQTHLGGGGRGRQHVSHW